MKGQQKTPTLTLVLKIKQVMLANVSVSSRLCGEVTVSVCGSSELKDLNFKHSYSRQRQHSEVRCS